MPKKGIVLNETACQHIKTHLKENTLSQEGFASQLGVDVRTLCYWLTQGTAVSLENLDKLIELVGIGVEDFFGGNDNIPLEFKAALLHPFLYKLVGFLENSTVPKFFKITKFLQTALKSYRQQAPAYKWPQQGRFKTIRHDSNQQRDCYPEIHIQFIDNIDPMDLKFTVTYMFQEEIPFYYADLEIKPDAIEGTHILHSMGGLRLKMRCQRPAEEWVLIKFSTWFGNEGGLFVINCLQNVNFKVVVEKCGHEIPTAKDVIVFEKSWWQRA